METPICLKHRKPLIVFEDEITGLALHLCQKCLDEQDQSFRKMCEVMGVDLEELFKT